MKRILTLTMNPAVDVSCEADSVFPEHKLRCGPPTYEAGGGGVNVSRAVLKLGGTSTAIHLAGGLSGQKLSALLDQEGIAHRHLPIAGATRENFSVLDNATGQQYRFVLPGPMVSEPEWSQCLEAISQFEPAPEFLVASGSLPPGVPADFYAQLARLAKARGINLILDTSGPALREALRAGIFLVKPSLRELRAATDSKLLHEDEQDEAVMQIVHDGGAEVVLASLGAAGVLMASKDGCERMRSPTVPVISKIGAGDSTVAGIVLALARDLPLRTAIQFGVAAGAGAVMSPGTQLCRREDVEKIFQSMQEPSAGRP